MSEASVRVSSEFGPVLPRPRFDVLVAHGYTASQVNALSVFAARECNWVNGMEMTHRALTAWSAIAEHLQLAPLRPEETELIAIGWKAIKTQHHHDLKTRGLAGKDKALLSRAFVRYWNSVSAPTYSPEDMIVDRLALAQIWRALLPTQREVLHALADYEDRHVAARALGMSTAAFGSALNRARYAFFELWHQHETPSKMWGADRPGSRHQNPMFLLRQRRRKAEKRAAQPATGPKATIGRPRRDLGVSDAELLDRHESGESLTSLGRVFGACRDVIKIRIDSARNERDTTPA
ncbi:hypothetical protein CLV63_102229 [Murinocardiopsis flavida]|uniref:DNA-directed RNA polymerase specialized sigma24 family protein n=1 Tax=Murinocardiopsis flavida TaxID=645275 RepID=A0A2P8DSA9_9ACTN|nr:hypothetical protein [Murinocardiopsis flavida]PSL00103.1 hypothetical protein CLV63_102229 [Murinocardiopsis flavida]